MKSLPGRATTLSIVTAPASLFRILTSWTSLVVPTCCGGKTSAPGAYWSDVAPTAAGRTTPTMVSNMLKMTAR